jgi:hypothetical protein
MGRGKKRKGNNKGGKFGKKTRQQEEGSYSTLVLESEKFETYYKVGEL